MSLEQVNAVLTQLGSLLDVPDFVLDQTGGCTIQLINRIAPKVNLQYLEDSDILMTFAEIGYLPSENATALLQGFLADNLFWLGGEGAVYAMDTETGILVLQRRDHVSMINSQTFGQKLDSFVIVAAKARKKLFEKALLKGTPESDPPSPNMRRV